MASEDWREPWSGTLPQFPLPRGKLPFSWVCLWVGQRAAPQVYQAEPPQRGWYGNLITDINCLFPRCEYEVGEEQPHRLLGRN